METLGYQWLRYGSAIGGATSSSYELSGDDIGTRISVEVYYLDGGGTAESIISAQTESVIGPVEMENTLQVPGQDTDIDDNKEPDVDVAPADDPIEGEATADEPLDEEEIGEDPAASFDLAAMVGEIRLIDDSGTDKFIAASQQAGQRFYVGGPDVEAI